MFRFISIFFLLFAAAFAFAQEKPASPAKTGGSAAASVPAVPQPPPEPELTPAETERLIKNRNELAKIENPSGIFNFFDKMWSARDYRAAALTMHFDTTVYTTPDLRKECLSKWSGILKRIEPVNDNHFPQWLDLVICVCRTADSEIAVEFVKNPDGYWQIGSNTVAKTDEIYEQLKNNPPMRANEFIRQIPQWMFHVRFGISYLGWSLLVLTFFAGILVYWIVKSVLLLLTKVYMHLVHITAARTFRTVRKLAGLIAAAYVWFYGFKLIVSNPYAFDAAYFIFSVFITVMMVLLAMRFMNLITEILRVRILAKNHFSQENVENLIVPFFAKIMKAVVVCIAVASIAEQFGWPLAAILSGMGIGGIAIAFAAKETVANLFGSVTVMLDQPFEIGDWIETNGVAGTVITVGMRSTRIKTGDYSIVAIPNNNLTTAVINNKERRQYRRFKTFLTLQYDTPVEKIDTFCEALQEMILKNPLIRKDDYFIGLNQLSDSSIDVLFNIVFNCPTTDMELRERADTVRNILVLAEEIGVHFAYPTQTLFVNGKND